MDTEDLRSAVDDLGDTITTLETALAPLLQTPLSTNTSKLPLLDKAKLYVLATYAIESLLFSSLRLHGTDAKNHPVFQELARVKEYFVKIKAAETAGAKPARGLDKEAAGRFIKHGLAGNEKFDKERSEREARDKLKGKRKAEEIAVGSHTRFAGAAKRIRAEDGGEESQSDGGRKVPGKAGRHTKLSDGESTDATTDTQQKKKSSKPPRSHGEIFKALSEGAPAKEEKKLREKKSKENQA